MSATFFASLLYLPQFMQKQLGYSPLEAGRRDAPLPRAPSPLVSFVAGPLYNRLGAKPLAGLRRRLHHASRRSSSRRSTPAPATARWSPGMVVLGIGIGSFYPTATTAGVTSVDESQTSLAGGIVYMFQIAGGSIGLGLTTTVFSAQAAFVDGIQAAFRLDAALSLVGFADRAASSSAADSGLAARRPRRTPPAERPRLRDRRLSPEPPRAMSLPGPPSAACRCRGRRSGRRCRGRRSGRRRRARRSVGPRPAPPISLSAPLPPIRVSSPGAAADRHRDRHAPARP